MSSIDGPRDGAGTPSAATKSPNKVLLPILFVVLAVAVLGAVIYYVVGVRYVMSLFGGGSAPRSAPGVSTIATSTPPPFSQSELQLPPGVSAVLAKRMYVEQIQSQVNLQKLAAGEIKRFEVTSVRKTDSAASVMVKAFFADGTSAPGVIRLVKVGGDWYFMSFTGVNTKDVAGSAATVNHGTPAQGQKADAKVVADSGITVFDYGVINTLLAEQRNNQSLVSGIIDGSLSTIELGSPSGGAGTTRVPANFSGTSATPVAGEALMIDATHSGQQMTFLTAFRTK